MTKSVRICGIDPGLNVTGYGVVDVAPSLRVARLIEAGVIRTDAKADLPERLAELAESMRDVLAEHRPDLIGIEQLYSHYRHPRTAILMGHARGVLLLAAGQAGIEVLSLSATRVKRTLTGNGHASKTQMQRAIMTTLGLAKPPEPADVADALAIALCAGARIQTLARQPAGLARATRQEVTKP
ncbi:MAG: crossover junction endodeoxyribonuclease RuvC [Phycisphaerae bacterium]|nr:crossover junction endodeoxyribonuclease RuvC [Phycisphaerae bacterium]